MITTRSRLRTAPAALLLAVSLLGAGCYTTTISTGMPAQAPSVLATERWHHTVVGGLAEISDPVDLEGVCPQGGWASIQEEVSFVNGLVSAVLSSIYTPRTYTIMCQGGPAAPPPAPPQ
jgi:hypothetical protein